LPNGRTALKYIYGRAFRAPNAFESYYTDGATMELPDVPLKKENIESHEVVLERTLTPWLGFTADAFYNNLDNLIDQVVDPATGLPRAVNVGADRGRGLEFELEAKRASGLSARASYALADAQDLIEGRRLANSPLQQAKFNSTLPIKRHVLAALELLYTSTQQSYQGTRVPASFLTNLTLSTRPLWGGWEFQAVATTYSTGVGGSYGPERIASRHLAGWAELPFQTLVSIACRPQAGRQVKRGRPRAGLGIAGLACLGAALALCLPCASGQQRDERAVRAAYVFNLTKYVQWPQEKIGVDHRVQRQSTTGEKLRELLEGKASESRSIHVVLVSPEEDLPMCAILYLTDPPSKKLRGLARQAREQGNSHRGRD